MTQVHLRFVLENYWPTHRETKSLCRVSSISLHNYDCKVLAVSRDICARVPERCESSGGKLGSAMVCFIVRECPPCSCTVHAMLLSSAISAVAEIPFLGCTCTVRSLVREHVDAGECRGMCPEGFHLTSSEHNLVHYQHKIFIPCFMQLVSRIA